MDHDDELLIFLKIRIVRGFVEKVICSGCIVIVTKYDVVHMTQHIYVVKPNLEGCSLHDL